MTGLPVAPFSICQILLLYAKAYGGQYLSTPYFITEYAVRHLKLAVKMIVLPFGKQTNMATGALMLEKGYILPPIPTPYYPIMFRVQDLQLSDIKTLFINGGRPRHWKHFHVNALIRGLESSRWHSIRKQSSLLRGGSRCWVDEQSLISMQIQVPCHSRGVYIPSSHTCSWYHISQTDFEDKFGLPFIEEQRKAHELAGSKKYLPQIRPLLTSGVSTENSVKVNDKGEDVPSSLDHKLVQEHDISFEGTHHTRVEGVRDSSDHPDIPWWIEKRLWWF